jgi:hypothetical protein
MDLTILYVILIIAFVIGLSFLSKYIKSKNIVSSDDMMFAMQVLKLSVEIVDQLNLKNEEKIKSIAQIVIDSVAYAIENMKDSKDIQSLAVEHAYEMCNNFNIELTDERKNIINQLISLLLTNNEK